MKVSLSYGIEEEDKSVPLNTGIPKEVDLSYGLDIKPKNRFGDYQQQPTPFGAKHPNLYGIYGAGKEVGKQILPYIKYIDPEERQKFLKLSQQHQTRELLFETLNAVLLGALKPIGQGVKAVAKPALQQFLPKTYKALTKPIGKTPKTITTDGLTNLAKLEGKVPIYHVGVDLKPGMKMRSDHRGLAWFSSSKKAYGGGGKGVPTTKVNIPRNKLLVIEDIKGKPIDPVGRKVIQATETGSKEEIFNQAEKMGYLAVQRGKDISIRPETVESLLLSKTPLPKYAGSVNLDRQAIPKPITEKYKENYAFKIPDKVADSFNKNTPTKEVSLDTLLPTQRVIRKQRVEKVPFNEKNIQVVRLDGELLINEGHHTVQKLINAGKKTAKVKFIDMGGIPSQGKLPKYAGSVNLDRQAIPKEMKLMELRAAETSPKKPVSWAETDKTSTAILNDPKKIKAVAEKIQKGTGLTTAEHDAMRKANVEGLFNFQEKIKVATTPEQVNAIQDAYRTKLFQPVSKAASEAGRTLNIYNREIGLSRIGKAFGKLERNLNPRELKAFKELDFDDSAKVKSFIDGLGNPKLMDYVYEYWYNQILSGIPTHVVNVASNTAWRAFQVPHRALTGSLDKMITAFTGKQRTRYINETVPLMAGMLKGKGKAVKSAWQVARHGKLQEFETKWAQEIGGALGAFDRSPSKIVRGIGKALTVPTKGLRAMDVYANSLAYDGQMNALARRAANLKGLKGTARKEFEKGFVANPSKKAHAEAMEFAKYTTFMTDPGKISAGIMRMRGDVPGGRFIIPFVNTIGNLLKRGVEMTPGLGLTLAKGQNPAEVAAKQIEGAIIGLFALHKAHKGEMTGGLPENKNEREAFYRQKKKPWAIKVGDTWVEYRRVEPFNTILASTAIAYDRIKNAKDEETATDIFFNMSKDFKNNLIDSSYLQGLTTILNRHGGAKGMAPRLASSFVPYSSFFRSIDRAYEAATEGSAKVRGGNDWLKAFSQTIPGLPKTPVKLNVWGEEIELQGGVFRQWLPYRWSKETTDITEQSLEKLGVYPGLPRKKFKYKRKNYELDEDIYRNFAIKYGKRAKEYLDIKFSQPLWQKALKNEKQHNRLRSKIDSKLKSLSRKEKRRAIREQRRRWKIKKLSGL